MESVIEKIDIKQFDLECEQCTSSKQLFFELYTNRIRYVGEYYARALKDAQDKLQGWKEEEYHYFDVTLKRITIVAVEFRWLNNLKAWEVVIESNGYPNSVTFYFQDAKEAKRIRDILLKWAFGL